jgi:hypothetical protein
MSAERNCLIMRWHEGRSAITTHGLGAVCRLRFVKSDRALVAGVHMTDKHRHRHLVAPHGHAPNWVLMILGACAVAIAVLAGALV